MSEITLAMPRLGETMDEGVIANWMITPGQAFRRGDPLVEIETDKTLVEYPALGDGVLVSTLVEPGATVVVGEPIARIEPAVATDWSDTPAEEPQPEAPPAIVAATPVAAVPATNSAASGRVRATPVARRLARNAGIDIATIKGHGPRGRIGRSDVEAALSGTGPAPVASAVEINHVMLVHGFAGDGRTWSRMAGQLRRQGFDVETPDMPGHGANLSEAIDVSSLVTDLVARINAASGKLHLVGHSLGAAVATLAASAVPERVASLTLLAPAGLGREIESEFVLGMARVTEQGELEHLLAYLGKRAPASGDLIAEMTQELRRGRLVRLADAIVGPSRQKVAILRQIEKLADQVPISAVFGLDDRVIPAHHAMNLPTGVSVHFVAGAGHMPQWDEPETIASVISRKFAR